MTAVKNLVLASLRWFFYERFSVADLTLFGFVFMTVPFSYTAAALLFLGLMITQIINLVLFKKLN